MTTYLCEQVVRGIKKSPAGPAATVLRFPSKSMVSDVPGCFAFNPRTPWPRGEVLFSQRVNRFTGGYYIILAVALSFDRRSLSLRKSKLKCCSTCILQDDIIVKQYLTPILQKLEHIVAIKENLNHN